MSCSTTPPRLVASSSQLQQQHAQSPTSAPQPPPPSSNTFQLLPPSLREILDAFSKNGGGDRELLLAILSAKRAEEDRLASSLSLQTQLYLLQQSQHQQPFHMIPQIQHLPRMNHLDAPPSPSSLSSSSSFSSTSVSPGPSTPPPSHEAELSSSIGPIRSAKLSLVRANLLARKEMKQRLDASSSSVVPSLPASPCRSPTPTTESRRSPEATRVALSGLMGVTGSSLGVVGASSVNSTRAKESFVRGGGSGEEEEVRVKSESRD